MFSDYYVGSGLTVKEIQQNSGSVFKHYLGSIPNELERYHSPFRSDNNPGCRFDWDDGVWKFVDNATYNGRLKFGPIQFVMAMFDCNFQEAVNRIAEEVKLEEEQEAPSLFIPEIKLIPQKLTVDNYFTKTYDLPLNYLGSQKVIGVDRYYCNSRKHRYLKVNAYYSPKIVETFCYVVNGKVELYFPGQDIKYVKATSTKDYYGPTTGEYIVLVEGKKDQMILNYHYGLNAHGLHNAYSKPVLDTKKIYIWLDPDETGIGSSKRLEEYYKSQGIEVINLTDANNVFDIADLYVNNKYKLDEIINDRFSFVQIPVT
jgi:5S rRNA maturation endonuclease (ribonuclease M5)